MRRVWLRIELDSLIMIVRIIGEEKRLIKFRKCGSYVWLIIRNVLITPLKWGNGIQNKKLRAYVIVRIDMKVKMINWNRLWKSLNFSIDWKSKGKYGIGDKERKLMRCGAGL